MNGGLTTIETHLGISHRFCIWLSIPSNHLRRNPFDGDSWVIIWNAVLMIQVDRRANVDENPDKNECGMDETQPDK
jgi:hypothetical protein